MNDDVSETAAKRVKLTETLDPLEILHSDIHELIFQHFSDEDVLEASIVSPLWFEATETSAKCMEKLHLRIVVPYSEEKSERFMSISNDLTSQRKYQNIYLHNFHNIIPEILKILEGRNWKKVYISVRNLHTKQDFQDVMTLIEPSVENLSISLTSIRNLEQKPPKVNFTFPKLKNLDLSRSHGLLMEEISENCKNIKTLRIDLDHLTWMKHQKFLHKILANNDKLEKLTLWRCSAEIPFQLEFIKTYKFKLKTFYFKNRDQSLPTDAEENCLFDFLESQANSLESLKLEEWMGIETFKLQFKLPKLKELTLDMFDAEKTIEWDNLQLTPSSSITKFHIDSYRKNRQKIKIFNAIFGAMPNLKFLTMDRLDDEVRTLKLRTFHYNLQVSYNFRPSNPLDCERRCWKNLKFKT